MMLEADTDGDGKITVGATVFKTGDRGACLWAEWPLARAAVRAMDQGIHAVLLRVSRRGGPYRAIASYHLAPARRRRRQLAAI